jgi:carbon storage regulator
MLVLSRKKSELIVIDGGIELTVLEIRGNSVRLGIEAPDEVPIHRSELQCLTQRNPAWESQISARMTRESCSQEVSLA